MTHDELGRYPDRVIGSRVEVELFSSLRPAEFIGHGRILNGLPHMPIGFHIYRDFGLLFIRGHGVITQTERINTMLAWLRDPDYEHCTDALFDVTAAQTTPRLAELREIIALLRQHLPASGPRRLAIVTGRPITYAVAQVFQMLIKPKDVPLQVRVFYDREMAWAWLRPDQPLPEPR